MWESFRVLYIFVQGCLPLSKTISLPIIVAFITFKIIYQQVNNLQKRKYSMNMVCMNVRHSVHFSYPWDWLSQWLPLSHSVTYRSIKIYQMHVKGKKTTLPFKNQIPYKHFYCGSITAKMYTGEVTTVSELWTKIISSMHIYHSVMRRNCENLSISYSILLFGRLLQLLVQHIIGRHAATFNINCDERLSISYFFNLVVLKTAANFWWIIS